MAGSYDLSGVMLDLILSEDGRGFSQPYYVPYLLLAYDDIYDVDGAQPDAQQIFKAPYLSAVTSGFDQTRSGSQINASLLGVEGKRIGEFSPADMLAPDFIDAVKNDSEHAMRQALRENDVYEWPEFAPDPLAPIRLYHCPGDQQVPYENSLVARDALAAAGASVVLKTPKGLQGAGHGDCALPTIIDAKLWLDRLSDYVYRRYFLEPGWNLLSVPLRLEDASVRSVFPKQAFLAPLWRSTQQAQLDLEVASTIEPGRAYWVFSDKKTEWVVEALGDAPAETTVALKEGWNLVGPTADVPAPEDSFVWEWDAVRQEMLEGGDILEAGKAYWLHASQAAELSFRP